MLKNNLSMLARCLLVSGCFQATLAGVIHRQEPERKAPFSLTEPDPSSFAQMSNETLLGMGVDPSTFVTSIEPVEAEYLFVPPAEIDPNSDPIDHDAFTPANDPELTDEELFAYQTAQVAYLVEELKNPSDGSQPVALPYCGIDPEAGQNSTDQSQRRTHIDSRQFKIGGSVGAVFQAIKGKQAPKPPRFCYQPPEITIRTWFNIFTLTQARSSAITATTIAGIIDELNQVYNAHGITFTNPRRNGINRFSGTSYKGMAQVYLDGGKLESQWYNEIGKAKYRHGPTSDLHLNLVERVVMGKGSSKSEPLGFCGFPGQPGYGGCVAIFDSLPGVSYFNTDTDTTFTVAHEVGHWLGLRHPHDTNCNGDSDGIPSTLEFPQTDYVIDGVTYGFKTAKQVPCGKAKTKKNLVDQKNWMSYAPRALGQSFLKDAQVSKMITNYYAFRLDPCTLQSRKRSESEYPYVRRQEEQTQPSMYTTSEGKIGSVLALRPNIRKELEVICSRPYDPDDTFKDILPNPDASLRAPPSSMGSVDPIDPVGKPPTTGKPPSTGSATEIRFGSNSNKCLGVGGGDLGNGVLVELSDCNGSAKQQWEFNKDSTKFKLKGTEFCLDAGIDPRIAVPLKIWQCFQNLSQQQYWYTGDNRIAVQDKGLCMDLRNGNTGGGNVVQTWHCTDGNPNQVWTWKGV